MVTGFAAGAAGAAGLVSCAGVDTATQIEVVASNVAAMNDFTNMSFTILWYEFPLIFLARAKK